MPYMNNDYYYELTYVYNDKKTTVRFNADVSGEKLIDNLKDFLKGCGWSEDNLKSMFNDEEV